MIFICKTLSYRFLQNHCFIFYQICCEIILVVCDISFIAVVLKCTIVVRKHFGIKFIECVLIASFIEVEKKSWRKMQKIFKKQHSDSSPTPLQEQPAGWQLPLRQSVGEIRQQRASSIKLGLFDSSFLCCGQVASVEQ